MKLYKHHNCEDTAVEVLKRFYIKEKDAYSLKVSWWRISRVNPPRPMYIFQRIKVPRRAWFAEWEVYE